MGVLLLPVVAGALGALAGAFGVHPVLGGRLPGLDAFRAALRDPALPGAVRLTFVVGIGGSLLGLGLALAVVAGCRERALGRLMRRSLPAMLAAPHLAFAIGFAFLIGPSGWLARIISPWLTGWTRPPDLATVQDTWGLSLAVGLALREAPFLLLVVHAAEAQLGVDRQLAAARSLGLGPAQAWCRIVLPRLWPFLRLPFWAVVAFAVGVVDMAAVLGPNAPPPLSVRITQLVLDPDRSLQLQAAAAAVILAGVAATAVVLTTMVARCGIALLGRAVRPLRLIEYALQITGTAAGVLILTVGIGSLVTLILWSVAGPWPFPAILPRTFRIDDWLAVRSTFGGPALTTVTLGLVVTTIAVATTVHLLAIGAPRALVYLPLLLPQPVFLPGLHMGLVATGLDGSLTAVLWTHLAMVVPYTMLLLTGPWDRLSPAYAASARCLGRSPLDTLVTVTLPLLRRPLAIAAAVGFSVALAQYLSTLTAGGGRVVTLATEALALAQSSDRRLAATAGLLLAALPLAAFVAASSIRAPQRLRAGP